MINQYVWKLYLESGGNEVVKAFEQNLAHRFTKKYSEFIGGLRQKYTVSKWIIDNEFDQMIQLYEFYKEKNFTNNKFSPIDEEDIYNFFISFLIYMLGFEENENIEMVDLFSPFIDYLASFSTELTLHAPDVFVPYYFSLNYNVLKIIADTFDITLPELPVKADYEGRLFYYVDLCRALHEFKRDNGWSSFELFAFLYDFAPAYIGGTSSYIISDLPDPSGAYFIGGSKDDPFLSESEDAITIWQCSPETKAGDMIVMYLCSPVSAVDSVWRSCSLGFIDPFFYYYRCTYICSPVKMKQVGIKLMRSDKIIGSMPIVKKNMQGLNGVELKPSEYNHLLELGKCDAMRLEYSSVNSDKEYSTEKEVEDNVIKPLLKKIGYDQTDYVQQLYLEIGNHNHALIPDFVLLPEIKGNNRSAFAVLEAKRSITKSKDLTAAKSQVRSYAKLLGAKYAAVVSQEKVWVFSSVDDYSDELFSCAIMELTKDNLYELKKIIGK